MVKLFIGGVKMKKILSILVALMLSVCCLGLFACINIEKTVDTGDDKQDEQKHEEEKKEEEKKEPKDLIVGEYSFYCLNFTEDDGSVTEYKTMDEVNAVDDQELLVSLAWMFEVFSAQKYKIEKDGVGSVDLGEGDIGEVTWTLDGETLTIVDKNLEDDPVIMKYKDGKLYTFFGEEDVITGVFAK